MKPMVMNRDHRDRPKEAATTRAMTLNKEQSDQQSGW
jgi:hypothetical protein